MLTLVVVLFHLSMVIVYVYDTFEAYNTCSKDPAS